MDFFWGQRKNWGGAAAPGPFVAPCMSAHASLSITFLIQTLAELQSGASRESFIVSHTVIITIIRCNRRLPASNNILSRLQFLIHSTFGLVTAQFDHTHHSWFMLLLVLLFITECYCCCKPWSGRSRRYQAYSFSERHFIFYYLTTMWRR